MSIRVLRPVVGAALLGLSLAGCQSAQDSAINAEMTCRATGLRPGTRTWDRCLTANYNQARRQSDQATSAVAIGAAAGVVGGAAIAASSRPTYRSYYYAPYRRAYPVYGCDAWGCW